MHLLQILEVKNYTTQGIYYSQGQHLCALNFIKFILTMALKFLFEGNRADIHDLEAC